MSATFIDRPDIFNEDFYSDPEIDDLSQRFEDFGFYSDSDFGDLILNLEKDVDFYSDTELNDLGQVSNVHNLLWNDD